MHIFSHGSAWQSTLAKTGFLTSLISYLLFALAEVLRPGFASRYFSIHLFLLAAIIFGFWWAGRLKDFNDHWLIQHVCAIIFGVVLFVLTWRLGAGFAEYRILMSLLAAAAPLIFLRIIRT
ncbi:hypothetical protein KJ611_01960 [Patescibacteria group bacterium]|nr:hypothetical protein [Patescibacteria group bacterium]MBU1705446.1 hypothetical protein [Patescibacteria group bacterium]